jgi:hypothetical protein
LDRGLVKYKGDVDTAVKAYLDTGIVQIQRDSGVEFKPDPKLGMQILSVEVQNLEGKRISTFSYENPFRVNIELAVRGRRDRKSFLSMDILDADMHPVVNSIDFEAEQRFVDYQPGVYSVQVTVPPILVPGEYRLSIRTIRKGKRRETELDAAQEVCPFQIIDSGSGRVQARIKWSGKVAAQLDWRIEKKSEAQA